MKLVALLYLFISNQALFAQDTLREQNSVMYSAYYVLHEDGSFEQYFHHCTGITYGSGTLKRGLFRWKFSFDSLQPQQPYSECTSTGATDSLQFLLKSIHDGVPVAPFLIEINKKRSSGHLSEVTISKATIETDTIRIFIDDEFFTVSHDWENCAQITLYLKDDWKTYVSGGKEIMRKKKTGFYLKSSYRSKDPENPHRKGKRMKILREYRVD